MRKGHLSRDLARGKPEGEEPADGVARAVQRLSLSVVGLWGEQ